MSHRHRQYQGSLIPHGASEEDIQKLLDKAGVNVSVSKIISMDRKEFFTFRTNGFTKDQQTLIVTVRSKMQGRYHYTPKRKERVSYYRPDDALDEFEVQEKSNDTTPESSFSQLAEKFDPKLSIEQLQDLLAEHNIKMTLDKLAKMQKKRYIHYKRYTGLSVEQQKVLTFVKKRLQDKNPKKKPKTIKTPKSSSAPSQIVETPSTPAISPSKPPMIPLKDQEITSKSSSYTKFGLHPDFSEDYAQVRLHDMDIHEPVAFISHMERPEFLRYIAANGFTMKQQELLWFVRSTLRSRMYKERPSKSKTGQQKNAKKKKPKAVPKIENEGVNQSSMSAIEVLNQSVDNTHKEASDVNSPSSSKENAQPPLSPRLVASTSCSKDDPQNMAMDVDKEIDATEELEAEEPFIIIDSSTHEIRSWSEEDAEMGEDTN